MTWAGYGNRRQNRVCCFQLWVSTKQRNNILPQPSLRIFGRVLVTCSFGVNHITLAWWGDYSTPLRFLDPDFMICLGLGFCGLCCRWNGYSAVISQNSWDSPFILSKICPCKKVDRYIFFNLYIRVYIYSQCKFWIEKNIYQRLLPWGLFLHAIGVHPSMLFTVLRIGVFSVYLYLVNIACIVVSWMGDEQIVVGTTSTVFYWGWWKGMQYFQVKGEWGDGSAFFKEFG